MVIYSIYAISETTYYIYDGSCILEYLYKKKIDSFELTKIRDYLSRTLRDAYAFTEININPPQPDFDKNYFQKVDIAKSLREINTTNISFYELYQKMVKRISELKDNGIKIKNGERRSNKDLSFLSNLYSINPIKFNIKKVNNNYIIICELNKNLVDF